LGNFNINAFGVDMNINKLEEICKKMTEKEAFAGKNIDYMYGFLFGIREMMHINDMFDSDNYKILIMCGKMQDIINLHIDKLYRKEEREKI